MYSTCIFCNAPLGANELLERFPVGRRIAFDQKTGRLWVVCRNCERWNLTPLETRWEAIEDAERLFRATPLKAAGENISLAQTVEGLELVRIGAPPRGELLAWRYGDQFGRRYRRHLVIGGGIAVASVGFGVASLMTSTAHIVWAAVMAASGAMNMANTARLMQRRWGRKNILVHDADNRILHVTMDDVHGALLVPGDGDRWTLSLPHRVWRGKPGKGSVVNALSTMQGEVALRALSRILPVANRDGGGSRILRDAAATLQGVQDVSQLVRLAAVNTEAKKTHFKVRSGQSHLAILPARIRLAMEMALHEDDERRAMEGELAELEARWREADALAKIADTLLMPPEIEAHLEALKERNSESPRAPEPPSP